MDEQQERLSGLNGVSIYESSEALTFRPYAWVQNSRSAAVSTVYVHREHQDKGMVHVVS